MSDCQTHIEIHHQPGGNQANRLPNALDSDFIKVDERKIDDLIVATLQMSKHIKYVNLDNLAMGSWHSFFNWESTSIFAQIADFDINTIITNYKLKRRKLLLISDPVVKKLMLHNFFFNFQEAFEDVKKKVDNLPASFQIKEYFKTTIPKIDALVLAIIVEINDASDVMFTIQHHLFNKKIHQIFGLLLDWKHRSHKQLYDNLDNYSNHSPHYALYLTFLKLFENAQKELNTFTKRHLDFYYNKVLHLFPQSGTPDYVHLCIEPHAKVPAFNISKDAAFVAGKDSEGRSKFYLSTSDASINQTVINSIYGSLAQDDTYYFEDFTELNASGNAWSAFQENTFQPLGLAIASPLFFLRGGDREIRLDFKDINSTTININSDQYDFYLTSEEEWLLLNAPVIDDNVVKLNLSAEDPTISAFNIELHEGIAIDTIYPVLKIVGKSGQLVSSKFASLDIEIEVLNYKQFKLFSNTGLIDHTKSFQPFGPFPRKGRSMIFSCNEFYQKSNATGAFLIESDIDFSITPERTGKNPQTGEMIKIASRSRGWSFNSNTQLSHLINGVWSEGTEWHESFGNSIINRSPIPFQTIDNQALSSKNAAGFSKITLDDDTYDGESYLEGFIEEAKKDKPSLPYVPTINNISFSYTARSSSNSVNFFHLLPKGHKKISGHLNYILPIISNQGELFVGLENVEPGNSISLLFQMAEGTANPRQLPVEPKWSYLNDHTWIDFDTNILGDETNGLNNSGIIQFRAPEDLDTMHQTILPKQLWWLKVSIPERVDAICNFVGIHGQALKAVLFDYETTGVTFEENIEAGTISKLFRPINQIKAIDQPYSSYSGKIAESDIIFYQRASERLRHKNKGITNWDYQRLVLDEFPQVYSVKCLNHYRYDAFERHNMSAGYVTLIPIAKASERNVPNYWKPLLDIGKMNQIKTFLERHTSTHVRIQVKPPILEKLDVSFNVKYRDLPGADSRLYTEQLKTLINNYLSPWAFDTEIVANFQTHIEKSNLIQIVEQQEYVDYISEFKVNHLFLFESSYEIDPSKTMNNVEHIIPSTPYSLFIPNEHNIEVITEFCCS